MGKIHKKKIKSSKEELKSKKIKSQIKMKAKKIKEKNNMKKLKKAVVQGAIIKTQKNVSQENANKKTKKKIKNKKDVIVQRPTTSSQNEKSQHSHEEESASAKKHDPTEIEQTIFVGNIPSNTKKAQLKSLFSQFGEIKTIRFRTDDGKKILKHKMRKETESLNAYIVMESVEAAEKALELSGAEFKKRHIRVTKAKKTSADDVDQKRIVFVGNLKFSVTDEKLYEVFSSCGEIEYARTIRCKTGCKGVAYVCFKKRESVTLALELNNTLLDDRPMRVERFSATKLKDNNKKKEKLKQLTGPARRIMEKEEKKRAFKIKSSGVKAKQTVLKQERKKLKSGTSKKSDFRGVEADKKMKLKQKKKKKNSTHSQILAKKIAPRKAN